MAGIYIHIPFCRQACHYCNFHFSTSLRFRDEMIAAIVRETELQKDYFEGEAVETIYFGGGTPSLLDSEDLILILEKIRQVFPVSQDTEITLEANPDDISTEKLTAWKETGINRLSIGVQSFFDEDLQWMNRAHTAQQAMDNLQQARKIFDNITIDLIYGTPGLTDEKWRQNVERAISMDIPHLSCYALTVEPKTPLDKMIRQHKREDIDPDLQSAQFLMLMQWAEEAGYEHYEISNFAKPGWRSRHNSSYWQGKKYLGLGPSAHSYNLSERQWNPANNNKYIAALTNGELVFEKELLTRTQQLNEYIMTSLRTMEGTNLKILEQSFGVDPLEIKKRAGKYLESRLLKQVDDALVLTKEGKLLADGIAASMFFDAPLT